VSISPRLVGLDPDGPPIGQGVASTITVEQGVLSNLYRFTERLDPHPTRQALLSLIRGAKRNKAFDDCRRVGLAIDGTDAGWRTQQGRALCRPKHNAEKQIQHRFVALNAPEVMFSLAANAPVRLGIGKESVTSKPSKAFPYVPAAGESRTAGA
jgi:hypothetical protein